METAAALLRQGVVVALKGPGGFQLACAARNPAAASRLRIATHRYGKPFTLMVADVAAARKLCHLSPAEEKVLVSPERPVVVLRRRASARVAPEVASGLDTLGIMLPVTPLHGRLLAAAGGPLVLTSGKRSHEPIAVTNDDALERLAGVADAFLLDDDDSPGPCADSVVRVIAGAPVLLRRARGYASAPIELPFSAAADILAVGAQQKSTFCLVKDSQAFLSPPIGDLDTPENVEHFRESLHRASELLELEPRIIAHDLNPDFASTTLARGLGGWRSLRIGVQHHHAHVVSCMVEHGIEGPVIGVAYDGSGYGPDGTLWGGEVLAAEWSRFRRLAHLRPVPVPGGDAAVRKPARMAASYILSLLHQHAGELEAFLVTIPDGDRRVIERQVQTRFNSPLTTSCGRLFDAVAALLEVCRDPLYEGQPAVELEAIADAAVTRHYPFLVEQALDGWLVDPGPLLLALWRDRRAAVPVPEIAAAFHNTVAAFTADLCTRIRAETGMNRVCLTGGCFQNALLTERAVEGLSALGFEVFLHRQVPPNDGGISLGQAAVAWAVLQEEEPGA